MNHPITRVLTILELLQSYGEMSGAEMARRLEVDPRTIRRYITMLQEMGIPIEAERGRDGAYFLGAGYKLPPLMFSNEEAFAMALSLHLARKIRLYDAGSSLESVSAKVDRVLPTETRQRIQAILDVLQIELNLVPSVEISTEILQIVGVAVQRHQQLSFQHTTFEGTATERTVDPLGVAYRMGRWYMVAYCHLREAIRTFRLDRIVNVQLCEGYFEPLKNINVLEHVERALASTPGIYAIEVIFAAELADVQRYIPAPLGELNAAGEQTRLTAYVQNLDWFAGFLAGIPLRQSFIEPPALRDALRQLVQRTTENLMSAR